MGDEDGEGASALTVEVVSVTVTTTYYAQENPDDSSSDANADVAEKGESAPEEFVERVLRVLTRTGIARALGGLYSGLGVSIGELVARKAAFRDVLLSFVFGNEKEQLLDVSVTNQAGLEMRGRPGPTSSSKDATAAASESEEVSQAQAQNQEAGEFALHARFADTRFELDRKAVHAKELTGSLAIGGMPTVGSIVQVARGLIEAAARAGAPEMVGTDVLTALGRVFPSTKECLGKFMHADLAEMDVQYLGPAGGAQRAVLLDVTGVVDMRALKREYRSVEHALQKVKHFQFSLVSGEKLPAGVTPTSVHESDEALAQVKAVAADEPMMLRMDVRSQRGHALTVRVVLCMQEGSDHLVYMDQAAEAPCRDEAGALSPVLFDEARAQDFLVKLSIHVKLAELGCASFHLPLIFLHLRNDVGAERFHVRLLHVGANNRLTRYALRPVINLDLFRSLLMRELAFIVEVVPPGPAAAGREEEGERLGSLRADFRLAIVPPNAVVLKCVRFFVRHQISHMDMLDLERDLCLALGADFEAFAA